MSTEIHKFLQNNSNSSQHVIVKGFMSEPKMLEVVKLSGKSTTALGRDGKSLMDFANDVVYQYGEDVYRKLKNAFDSGDTETLMREWQCAKPITIL